MENFVLFVVGLKLPLAWRCLVFCNKKEWQFCSDNESTRPFFSFLPLYETYPFFEGLTEKFRDHISACYIAPRTQVLFQDEAKEDTQQQQKKSKVLLPYGHKKGYASAPDLISFYYYFTKKKLGKMTSANPLKCVFFFSQTQNNNMSDNSRDFCKKKSFIGSLVWA